MLSKDDIFSMYKACKDSKDKNGFHDFVGILQLYEINDDNTMSEKELFRRLTKFGEKLTKEEAKSVMKKLCEAGLLIRTSQRFFLPARSNRKR